MSKSTSNNLGSENMLFDLLNGFMSISSPGFQNQEKSMYQWTKFKELITNRPIDYHQVFTFISKMQETDATPGQQSQQQLQQQQQEEDFEGQSSSSSNQNTETYSSATTKLHHSQKQNTFLSNGSTIKENGFSSNQLSGQHNNGHAGNQNGNQSHNNHHMHHSQNNNGTSSSASQGRTNNFVKNTQSSYQSNSIQSTNQMHHGNNNNSHSTAQQQQNFQPSSSTSSANNNYYNSTQAANPSVYSNQHNNNQNSLNNELFAGSSINMFKTAAGNLQSNMIQNSKKGEPRSSTRDQFNQGTSSSSNSNSTNINNFNAGSSMNMYSSNGNTNNPTSSRNNYRSSFNNTTTTATSAGNNNNNSSNNGIQQSNSKNQNGNNFSSSGGVPAMVNMYSSKENYSHFNNNGSSNTIEKVSPMNQGKFASSFKGGNTHSIYNNNHHQNSSQSSDANNQISSQQSQQSPEKMSSQKNVNLKQNNHNNQHNNGGNQHMNINNFHGLPNETSTFVKDENLYSIKSFSDFLKEHTRIQSLGKNTQFAQTSVLELQNNSNSLLKLTSIAYFVNLISELPHPESPPNTTCAASKLQLIDIFLKVYNKKLKIHVSSTHIFTSEQLISSFTKNTGLLIQLYLLHGQNTSKLVKAFLYQVQHDPLYLDSLVILIKELASEFVEECDYDAIASILMSQQQQQQQQQQLQQQNSLSSTCASLSQLYDNKAANLTEKERRAKVAQKLRQPSWKEVKPEWLFLLSLSLQRPIELFNLRDNKLEQTLFKSKKMQISEITANNKINIVTVTHAENKYPVYYLMTMKQAETELYASLKINFKKNELKLNEEVNFPYLLKQISREREQNSQQQQQNQQQPQQQHLNTPSAQQAQQQLSPTQQQQSQTTIPQSNSNTNLNKEYSMGHRSSKLGLHLNQLQQPQLPNAQTAYNNNQFNHHHHNSSVEDQGRKSHSIKTNPISNLNTNGSTSNLNNNNAQLTNPGASSPRMHNFMIGNNLNAFSTQNTGNQSLQQPQQPIQQQQQQIPSLNSQESKQNVPFSKIANKFSHYENISPKYNLNTLNFQKSTATTRQQSSNSTDDWNKNLLYAKMKDLIFTLNINSEQLNSLARFQISNTQNGVQSKENIQPKSPLKYKSVLYPINSNTIGSVPGQTPTSTQNISQNGGIAMNGFNNALNNIMIGQGQASNQNNFLSGTQQTQATTTNTLANNNLNNTSNTSSNAPAIGGMTSSNSNFNNNIINNVALYSKNNPALMAGQSPFNINVNSKLNTNSLASVSPSQNLALNPFLNSSSNTNNFTNSFGKNTNNNNLQSFLNPNNFNFMQPSSQQQQLNPQNGAMNMSNSLNANSTLNSNSALNSISAAQAVAAASAAQAQTASTGVAPGTVTSKRYPTYTNNTNIDGQERDIFNKLSPRRNLNTQY